MKRAPLVLALLVASCGIPDPGPMMRPGQDCMTCHGNGRARSWSIAGTVYPSENADPSAGLLGVEVQIVDATGFSFSLRTNQAGNFYSAETVAFPVQACISNGGQQRCMESQVSYGSCNACHTVPPNQGAPGRLAAP